MIYWVADIGGTNCRLAEFVSQNVDHGQSSTNSIANFNLVKEYNVQTQNITTAADLIQCFESKFNNSVSAIDCLGLAIAGPVKNDFAKLTNGILALDRQKISKIYGIKHVVLLNDFVAQAYACADPKSTCYKILGKDDHVERAVRAIVGVGTGLGCAVLVPNGPSKWQALSSEAGHMPFPFYKDEEDFALWLKRKLNKSSLEAEDVLSGRGLVSLHNFLTGEDKTPAEIAASHLSQETATQYWWAGFYGRFCKMWILATLPFGGLYVSGGIAIQNPTLINSEAFTTELGLQELEDKIAPFQVFIFKDTKVGLYGCVTALQEIMQ